MSRDPLNALLFEIHSAPQNVDQTLSVNNLGVFSMMADND